MNGFINIYYERNHIVTTLFRGVVKLKSANKFLINKFFSKKNMIAIPDKLAKKVKICCVGENNQINIKNIFIAKNITINIFGDNNLIEIEEGAGITELNIQVGADTMNTGKVSNVKVKIAKKCSIESAKLVTFNSNTSILIGERCMLSSNIYLYNSDSHPIYENGTNKIINRVKDLIIGNHCWIGQNVTVLKNSQIADDCILGYGSVVSGKFLKPNCAIAGNPARVIKENINWDCDGSGDYTDNVYL